MGYKEIIICSFYGSKSKIVKYYPKPKYNSIIEPFAGSARYSLEYFENDVTLVEKDLVIYNLWKYLIQTTPQDIENLPDVPNATRLTEIQGFTQLCQEEKSLIGFCCNGGSAVPKNVSGRHNFNSWNKDKIRISKSLYKIRHWNIIHGDYFDAENKLVTWFIDPPYQNKGKWYRENKIDYNFLGEWCKSRLGETIVCENVGANWLDFKFLKDVPFTHFKTEEDLTKKTKEGIWYNLNIDT